MIKLTKNITIPHDIVTQKQAFIGRTGSGKTYGATKLSEELLRNHIQTIALDPVGVWWGLRMMADGKTKGFDIIIFGGLHADVPITPHSGKLIADVVVDKHLNAIIDVSQFETDADKARFATAFGDQFFLRKKAAPSPVHLFLEEGQEFIPQNPQKGEERMLHVFQRIWKLGRNFGIGGTIITQRPQEVNKKALNQTEALYAFQITGTHERKAIVDWIRDKGLSKHDIDQDLAGLSVGQCFLWSPQWLKVFEKITILPKTTWDASQTPKSGSKPINPKPLAPADITALRAEIEKVVAEHEANDPGKLRKRIIELEKQIKSKSSPVDDSGLVKKYRLQLDEAKINFDAQVKYGLAEKKRADLYLKRLSDIGKLAMFPADEIPKSVVKETKLDITKLPDNTDRNKKLLSPIKQNLLPTNGDAKLGPGETKILIGCAQYPNGVTRAQLTTLTGYKRSSRDTYLQRLNEKGFTAKNGDRIEATQSGLDFLGGDFKPLPTGTDLQAYYLDKLPAGEIKLLQILLDAHPDGVTRDELSDKSGYQRSSRDTYIQRMNAKEIIKIEGGKVFANDNLFDN